MLLHELPSEVLFRVASYLDVESLIAFGQMNFRLEEISLISLKHVTIKEPSESLQGYLVEAGSLVRSMDLSNRIFWIAGLTRAIENCLQLTELNVVNSSLRHTDLLSALSRLPKLESLSFTMQCFEEEDEVNFLPLVVPEENRTPFRSIKKLYVELAPTALPMKLLVELLNNCESLETAHAFFIGDTDTWDDFVVIPELAADRWRTLHTFIASWWFACKYNLPTRFLQKVFANNSSSDCTRWIGEDKKVWIYEHGYFNWEDTTKLPNAKVFNDVDFIRRYQVVKMSGKAEQTFKTPWGLPSSLRIISVKNWGTELNRMNLLEVLSPNLRELDLTECHNGYTHEFKLSLIASAPNLRVLGLPVCSVLRAQTNCGDEMWKEESKALSTALEKLRLRELLLAGNRYSSDSCHVCEMRLSSVNFIPFHNLTYLEEFTLDTVALRKSAHENLWNERLRTLKYIRCSMPTARGHEDLSYLPSFLQRCPNLRNLKISYGDMRRDLNTIVQTVARVPNLRQLCLEPGARNGMPVSEVVVALQQLPQNLEIFHLHIEPPEDDDNFTPSIEVAVNELGEARGKKIYFESMYPCLSQCVPMDQFVCGRGLCWRNTSFGYVKPVGWEVE